MKKRFKVITASMMIPLIFVVIPLIAYDLIQGSNVSQASVSRKLNIKQVSGQPLKINKFLISPDYLKAGQTAKLLWNVSGAAQVFITNQDDLDNAEVGPTGYLNITPLKTASYVLTAYDHNMVTASALATIDVNGQPPTPQAYLDADPINIIAGDKVRLTWKTLFAHTVSIDHGIGMVGSYGLIEIKPEITTTYTLAATGLGGSKIANITITVLAP